MIKLKYLIKLFVSNLLEIIKFYDFSLYIQKLILRNKFIRVLNYHCTPEEFNNNFRMHMEYFSKNYVPVNEDSLLKFLNNSHWPYKKPGLIICFDDGLSCNMNNALSILEEKKFNAWFMIPIGFCVSDINKQKEYMKKNNIHCSCKKNGIEECMALSTSNLKDIEARGHVLGSHTINHIRMSKNIGLSMINKEMIESKQIIEKYITKKIRSFCWVGGEEENYNPKAVKVINRSNYIFSFTNDAGWIKTTTNPKNISRINIESSYSLMLCKFYMSGFIDFFYYFKRKRLKRKINSLQ